MKKIVALAVSAILCLGAIADGAFEFVNSSDGYSYIQINENLDSFAFNPDWHSLGNAGRVGYVVYTSDMNAEDRAAYMEANANNPQFGKHINGGTVNLGSLNAGDKVGFYESRPNGGVYTHTSFEDWKGGTWLTFDKNGGHGKDEWLGIGNVETTSAGGGSGGGSGAPSGAPLPGALAVMLVGAVGAGAYKAGKKKA